MRSRLGQHFLFDPSILRRIILAADLSPDDLVVEIGPGKGRLTRMLSGEVKEVLAIEVDPSLCEGLKRELSDAHNITVLCGDALKYPYHRLPPFKVVANIPFYITTPLIFRLLSEKERLISATLTLQREVAERIVAGPGGKDYGILTLMVRYRTEPKIAFFIPRGAFVPPPEVDSAVIHMRMLARPRVCVSDERLFFRVIKTAFSQRRKMIANSLRPLCRGIREVLGEAGIDPGRRAETLTMDEFARITELIRKQGGGG